MVVVTMSEGELNEICTDSSYMQRLNKSVAEMYLPKHYVDEWLTEQNDDKFFANLRKCAD
ncbi:hypothetical protein ACTXT7_016804 [Hymenolepis weldensis]